MTASIQVQSVTTRSRSSLERRRFNPQTIAGFAEVIDRLVADQGIRARHQGSPWQFRSGLDLRWLMEATLRGVPAMI